MKVWCTEHNQHMRDCFYEHHTGTGGPVLKLKLPCGHLCDRPTNRAIRVTCECGRRWMLQFEDAGTWSARETV